MRSVDVSHWGLLCRFGQHDRHGAFPILSPSDLAEVCTAFTLLGLGQRGVIYKDLFQACDFACGLVPCDFLSHRAFRTIMDISMFRSSNLSRCGKRLNTADSSFKFQRFTSLRQMMEPNRCARRAHKPTSFKDHSSEVPTQPQTPHQSLATPPRICFSVA